MRAHTLLPLSSSKVQLTSVAGLVHLSVSMDSTSGEHNGNCVMNGETVIVKHSVFHYFHILICMTCHLNMLWVWIVCLRLTLLEMCVCVILTLFVMCVCVSD